MGYNHPDILKSNPYYDDFEDTKNFLRILFKPGYAVQARELTQLQTLLQNQIAKFGSHIFKDGSQVFGGGVSLSDANYIRTQISNYQTVGITTAKDLIGRVIVQGSSTRAKIIDAIAPIASDNYTILVIQYLTGNVFNSGILTIENYGSAPRITYPATTPSGVDKTGVCQTLSVDSGIFYTDGLFVNNSAQTATLHVVDNGIRKFRDPILTSEGVNNRIGFEIERTIVTFESDNTLVDPARGFYNYNAPGADRYTINLNLIVQEFDPQSVEPGEFVTQDFIELARVVYGVLDYVKKIPTYAELVDTLARRTYDESGNYTVRPFELEVKNHYRDDVYSLFIKVNAGASTNFFVGDHIVNKFNGNNTKIGKIVSFETYTPTEEEINSGSTELPTHVIKVTREKNYQDKLNYAFFTSSTTNNQNIAYYASVDFTSDYELGLIKRVTATRDPDGVYSPEEGGVENKFVLSVKPGKAYVFGYEFETINNSNIVVDKERTDSVVAVNDYNIGANVGNYFLVTAPFNTWNGSIDIEELPYIKFGGRYIRITIPQQEEDKRSAYLKYWSPLVADQNRDNFRSVAFITTESALATESITGHTDPNDTEYLNLIDLNGEEVSTDSEDDQGFIRPQETTREQSRYIGGGTSLASYGIVNMSNNVESNISRFVFTDPWHGNFTTSYDLGSEETTGNTYTTQEYPIKQIKCLDTANPTSIQVTTGNALRWVPASATGANSTSGSTLFVQVTGSVRYDGSTEIQNAHFNVDDGVVFTDPSTTTNPISYGTSIAYVIREANTKRIIIKPNGSLGCNASADCSDEGQGGFFSVGDIVTQNYILDGVEVQAVGEVLAVGGDFTLPTLGNDGVELYIQATGVYEFFGVNDSELSSENITELGCIIGPCGVYRPRSSVSLNDPTCGELVRIGFRDSENVGAYTINETAFQYNYIALQEDVGGVPSYNINDLVKGRIISWDETEKELIVLETQGRFEKYNGTVYQLASGTEGQVKYGGRGWDKLKTKFSADTTPLTGVTIYDVEKVSGIFVDIADQVSKNFVETSISVFDYNNTISRRGEAIVQVAVPNIDNYTGTDFATNDLVYQNNGTNGIARGVILSFTHRDLTNPADTSNTVIIIQPINEIPFRVGTANVGLLRSESDVSLQFDLSGNTTTKTKEIIGCGRLRFLKKQESTLYQASFFDIKMDYLPDLSRKYNLNEVSEFFYEEDFANTIISNFEDEDIQLASGTSEDSYIFKVDPIYGIDENSSTDFFTFSKVFDPDLNTLLFAVPGSTAIKTVGELDYRIQQQYTLNDPTDFATDTITFNTFDPYIRFIGGESSTIGKVDSNDLQEHYILLVNGQIVDLNTTAYSVTTNNYSSPTSNSTISIRKTNGQVWSGVLYVHLIANLNANPRPNVFNTDVQETVRGGIRIKVPKRFTETVSLKKTKSGLWKANLSKADVFAIDKIYTESSNSDIKDQFTLFTGQTDNLYDFGQITLKNEYLVNDLPESQEVIISYRYFYHSGQGPITVDSYVESVNYNDIPYFTSPSTGKTYKLDSVIDMRPLKIKSSGLGLINQKWIPAPATSFNADYEYYLSRGYKLVITRDLKFKLISGVAAFEPELPADDENAMTIYDIIAEPYIFNKNDIVATIINNRRYTMKDIIGLDERIQTLEQFAILDSLEKQVESEPIIDASTQLQRIKSAILVDNFASHAKSDTKNSQYNICIDPEENLIRPPFKMDAVELDLASTTQTNLIKTSDNVIMLPYDENTFISQYSASSSQKINSFNDVSWIGSVRITPSSDSWFDVQETPDVRENENGVNDALELIVPNQANNNNNGYGMEWDFWKRKWFGKRRKANKQKNSSKRLSRSQRLNVRSGFAWTQNRTPAIDYKTPNTVNVGENKIVDKSVVPFIRERSITAIAEGLKPFTTVYVFFDDVNITAECQILNNVGSLVTTGGLKTNNVGSLQFTFDIAKRQYKAGQKLLVITDSSTNNINSATTIAETVYNANGAIEISKETYLSTRNAIKKPSSYTKNISDPLAQTFFIDETQYPQGVFVSSVDIFFASKDTILPVTLELRPTESSYPATRERTTIYPFASKTLNPASVVVSSTPNTSVEDTKTTFTFSTPVHLLPGEHSIVLRSNSSEYSVYVAEIGELLLDGTGRIVEQAAIGSFFKSQNAGKWEKYENIDMMFGINKCDFTSNTGTITINDVDDVTKPQQIFETYIVNNDEIKFNNTSIEYDIRTVEATGSVLQSNAVAINANENIKLSTSNKIIYNGNSIELMVTLNSSDSNISPIIDLDRLNIISIGNVIENNTTLSKTSSTYNGELDPITPIVNGETARCRYITKIIELEKGFESTNVNVTFGANIPQDTRIQVFLKQQSVGKDSIFDEEPYIQLLPNKTDYVSPDENTFEDITYSLPIDLEQPFGKFAIKICLYSSNPVRIPKAKELRIVSII